VNDGLRLYLGPALRRLRQHRRLLQYQAAKRAGITKTMLSGYETGSHLPSLRTLEALLVALRADLRHLDAALRICREEHHRHNSC